MSMAFEPSVTTCLGCSGAPPNTKCAVAECAASYSGYDNSTQTCTKIKNQTAPPPPPPPTEVVASLAVAGAVSSEVFLAQVTASMPPGSTAELQSFKMTAESSTGGIPGDKASFGTPAMPTAKLTQYKDGLAGVFTGISSSDVTIKSVTQEPADGGQRRRLQSGSTVSIASAITSTDPVVASSMATKVSNTTAFKAALTTSVNNAGTALATLISSELDSTAPAFVTEVKVKVTVPGNQSADAATATLSNSTAMASVANAAVVSGTPAITSVSATVAPPAAAKADKTVTVTLYLATTIAAVAADSSFNTKFAKDVGAILNVPAARITVESTTSGSVRVIFSVAPAANGDGLAVNAVLAAFAAPGVALPSLGLVTAAAVVLADIAVKGGLPPAPSPVVRAIVVSDDDGMGAGWVILIVLACLVFVVLVGGAVWWVLFRSSEPKQNKPATGNSPGNNATARGTRQQQQVARVKAIEARLAKIKTRTAGLQQASATSRTEQANQTPPGERAGLLGPQSGAKIKTGAAGGRQQASATSRTEQANQTPARVRGFADPETETETQPAAEPEPEPEPGVGPASGPASGPVKDLVV
jgi:hypothetical protein